jgi:hypothetical protein
MITSIFLLIIASLIVFFIAFRSFGDLLSYLPGVVWFKRKGAMSLRKASVYFVGSLVALIAIFLLIFESLPGPSLFVAYGQAQKYLKTNYEGAFINSCSVSFPDDGDSEQVVKVESSRGKHEFLLEYDPKTDEILGFREVSFLPN